jgi:hypothetical protein
MNFLRVDYYANPAYPYDGLTVVKDFDRIFVPCDQGNYTLEQLQNMDFVTILELDTMASGYKRFKVKGVPGTMKGYGFVYSSDSRFNRQYGSYPIALHDRRE